jgi:hypothetical protein
MEDWLNKNLSPRERMMYRIAMCNAKDPQEVDTLFYRYFGFQKLDEEQYPMKENPS